MATLALGIGVSSLKALSLRGEAVRPKDVWDTDIWGGLPAFVEQEEYDLWNVTLDPRPKSLTGMVGPGLLPNPCSGSDFHAPVYEYRQWRLSRVYLEPTQNYPMRYQLSVTLHDSANNYSVQCTGSTELPSAPYDRWHINCVPETGFQDDRFQGQTSLSMWMRLFEADYLSYDPLTVTQYWYCPPPLVAGKSPYP